MAKAARPAAIPATFWPTASTLAAPVKEDGGGAVPAGVVVAGGALVIGAVPVGATEVLL